MEPSFIAENKVVALAIASFSFLSVLYVYRKSRLSAVLPPGPPKAPILGNRLQMPKERPWLKYAQWTEEYGKSYLAMSRKLILHFRLGDIVHVRVFNQHLIILSNYEDATRLMHEAKYSDRLQTVMIHELYVSSHDINHVTDPVLQQDGLQLGCWANAIRSRVALWS